MDPRVSPALAGDDLLGEGPCWDDRDQVLSWVDIKRCLVHSWSPLDGTQDARVLPREVSLALPRERGGRVVTQVDGLFLDDGERLAKLCEVDADNPFTRLNDGCCDHVGRLWAGTYSTRGEPEAGLYCISPEGEVTAAIEGMIAANGVAWSADGSTAFVTDTGHARIDAYVPDAAGDGLTLGGTVMSTDGTDGRPDGLALDSEGGLWTAMWGGGHLRRYDAAGQLTERVDLPVTYPTSVAFGGESLDALFVTTSSHHLATADVEPLAGSLLAYTPGTTGLETRRFRG